MTAYLRGTAGPPAAPAAGGATGRFRRREGHARRGAARGSAAARAAATEPARSWATCASAKLARAVVSERQLQEVMIDFWENHFTVFAGKGQTRFFLPAYERDVIRPHALGKFRDLLGAVAKSPAMLFYLDNWQSVADSALRRPSAAASRARARSGAAQRARPERELRARAAGAAHARRRRRLHAAGRDRGGARAHRLDDGSRGATAARSSSARRSTTPARRWCSARRSPAGRGIEDGEEVLDIARAASGDGALHRTKLARRFVSDDPPAALVDRAARDVPRAPTATSARWCAPSSRARSSSAARRIAPR